MCRYGEMIPTLARGKSQALFFTVSFFTVATLGARAMYPDIDYRRGWLEANLIVFLRNDLSVVLISGL